MQFSLGDFDILHRGIQKIIRLYFYEKDEGHEVDHKKFIYSFEIQRPLISSPPQTFRIPSKTAASQPRSVRSAALPHESP